MPEVSSGGIPIRWEEAGSPTGRPVLLVHGFASNGAQNWLRSGWENPLAEAGIRAILVDLRGHGRSARPAGPEHYSSELFVADLVAVMDAAGAERVGYLGYSLGARLGWELAIAHPDRIGRLVLGGFAVRSPMRDFDVEAARSWISQGTAVADPLTRGLLELASLVPGNDLARLVDVADGLRGDELEDVSDGPVPSRPTCIINGERDTTATGGAALAAEIGAEYVELKARSHSSAVSSHRFKEAAIAWLKGSPAPVDDRRDLRIRGVASGSSQPGHRPATRKAQS